MIESRGMIESYPERGIYKTFPITKDSWNATIQKELVDSAFLDESRLAFIMTFNVFNPSVNLLQAFKLIFNFQNGGIILMEYDVIMVNLKLFATDR